MPNDPSYPNDREHLTSVLVRHPPGSPWRDKISLAILELQEKGVIQMLYNKWWKSSDEVCSRMEKDKDHKANTLGIDNIGTHAPQTAAWGPGARGLVHWAPTDLSITR